MSDLVEAVMRLNEIETKQEEVLPKALDDPNPMIRATMWVEWKALELEADHLRELIDPEFEDLFKRAM